MNKKPSTSSRPGTPARSAEALSHLAPLLLFVFLTLILTAPVVLHLKREIIGKSGDSLIFLWNFWWTKKALLDPHLSLFFTDYLYYPDGASLAFHTLSLFNGIASIPLQSGLGLIGTYSVLILLGFVLGAWGAYLLAYSLTRHRLASIFAGIAFGFCPFHVSNAMADLNVASVQFIPFTLLFLVRWRRQGRYRDAALTGVFLGLTALSHLYYLLFVLMAIVLFSMIWILRSEHRRASGHGFLRVVLFAAVSGILLLPIVVPMIQVSTESTEFANPGRQDAYSADLLAYVVPSLFSQLLREQVRPFYAQLPGNMYENTVTPGLVVLCLAAFAVWGRRKFRNEDRLIWAVLGLASVVLSLGSTVQVAGTSLGASGYLPYRWLIQSVPLISHARVPSRFAVLAACSASVLAAYGMRDLLQRRSLRPATGKRTVVVIVLFALLIAELWAAPFPTTPISIPRFFDRIAKDGEDCTVLHLPLEKWNATTRAMYYQTSHGKRMLNGAIARVPAGVETTLEEWKKTPLDYDFMLRNRVRYIVLLTSYGLVPWHHEVMEVLERRPWLKRVAHDETLIVAYRVSWPEDP